MIGEEPNIIINGQQLSLLEAMTLRVALGNFCMFLNQVPQPLGTDETGITLARGYLRCANAIHRKMSVTK